MTKSGVGLLLTLSLCGDSLLAQNVLTQHNDLNRTGWNNQETHLNKKNVKPGTFGMVFSRAVDDQIYAQPLIMNVNIPGIGARNVVFVATVNNSVYAFDADSANITTPYWQVSLLPSGTRPLKNTDMTGACGGGYQDFSGNIGIVGTPVIDQTTNTIYLVARSLNISNTTYQQYLHALDVTSGAERPNSPKLITASVNGGGAGSVGGIVSFDPQKQNQRPGLLLLNGIVYIAWSSHCDWGPYHGWVIGYDKTSLQQKSIYNSTPEGYNGGIWMSGGAPSADDAGNIYIAVGNGSVGSNGNYADITNRSESALKLTPNGTSFTISSFFSPNNIPELEAGDLDFGVTQIMLIPSTNRAITGVKDGNLYLLNRDTMGGYNEATNNVLQDINLGVNAHLRSSLTYYKGEQKEWVYSWSENALLKAFPYSRTYAQFDLANTTSSGLQGPTGNNGALLSISSNGSADSTAILWATHAANGDANQSVRPGILRAIDATDVTKELWNSSEYPNDNPGNYAKFVCPTIANGKVYLATFSNKLVVYGLTGVNSVDTCNSPNIGLNKYAWASSVETAGTTANFAFDGNPTTRWSSLYSDPQFLAVDLGKRYDLCQVVLDWETALGSNYEIQVSDDSLHWTDLVSITGNAGTENYLPVNGSGRYVRMLGMARGTQYGYSLWEFQVYGTLSANQCAPPSGLLATDIYENSAFLNWNANGANRFTVQYKTVSAGNWTLASVDSAGVTLAGLACTTSYFFQVQGFCSASDSSLYSPPSAFSTLTCNSDCAPLPTRWTTQDIGDVGIAGSACYNNEVFELKASGDDIWNTQDAFHFAYKTFVGDGEIKARVVSMDQSDPWNKCGIMFRESLTPGSRHAFIALTSGNGVAFQNRLITDGISNNVNVGAGVTTPPYWIRLVKSGSLFTAYSSPNGNTWTQVGDPVDAGFGSVPVYAGLALCGHNNSVLSVATIDNYQVYGTGQVALQNFTASLTLNKTVALQWITTLETNLQDFVVQRSNNNVNYVDIDSLPAVNNGEFTQTYNDEDKSPLPNINYYRLLITSLDGTKSYSAPVYVKVSTAVAPLLYPNPATQGFIHIEQGEDGIKAVNLYDITGRVVIGGKSSLTTTVDIPVFPLVNGLYVIEIITEKAVYRERLIIQN